MNEYTLHVLAARARAEQPYYNTMFPPSPYYRFLKQLAAELPAHLSVVLGVCGGGCCLHLCQGNPAGVVVGLDIVNDYPDNMTYIRQNHGNFFFMFGDSVTSAEEVYTLRGPVDVLFVDTIHTYERTVQEFQAWLPYLSEKAVVCFDDLDRVEMGGFWEWLPGNKLRLDELHHEGGFGVWWR